MNSNKMNSLIVLLQFFVLQHLWILINAEYDVPTPTNLPSIPIKHFNKVIIYNNKINYISMKNV